MNIQLGITVTRNNSNGDGDGDGGGGGDGDSDSDSNGELSELIINHNQHTTSAYPSTGSDLLRLRHTTTSDCYGYFDIPASFFLSSFRESCSVIHRIPFLSVTCSNENETGFVVVARIVLPRLILPYHRPILVIKAVVFHYEGQRPRQRQRQQPLCIYIIESDC